MKDQKAPEITLTEFLLARVAEDEADAQSALHHERAIREIKPDWNIVYAWTMMLNPPGGAGGGGHNFQPGSPPPARVLAECEAKRLIVEAHGSDDPKWEGDCPHCGIHGPCYTLRIVALPYADHPDCREEWRP